MQLSFLERNRIVTLKEAAKLRGTSVDTLRRNESHKFVKIGSRLLSDGRVSDALMLPEDGEPSGPTSVQPPAGP